MTTEYKSAAGPFWAFTRICLNNWHYISRKTLTLNEEINFFTGHSGSGKSTVIDALQLVLYANTDGRGFFNKAAAEDVYKRQNHILRIGSRKSVLALRQAEMIAEQLKNKFPGLQTEILTRDTLGDQLLHSPLQAFGGKGAFVSEFEQALLEGSIDLAVHSACLLYTS